MALALTTTSNLGQARSLLGSLTKLQRQAAVSALNRTAQQVRTEASRKIREQYPGFRAGDVRRSMRVNRSQFRNLSVELVSTGKRVPLARMSARKTRRGVSVRITKARKTISYTSLGPFQAEMKSGHVGIYNRRTGKRLPIDELFTIALSEAFAAKEVRQAMQRKATEVFIPRFRHELERRSAGEAPSLVLRTSIQPVGGEGT